ncbi:MAG: Tad domain-containing protein [Candidatus Riflebacteria bacterium]|nr:Tad domain-containing protein [Candidatus Riflebacteria bacterium]
MTKNVPLNKKTGSIIMVGISMIFIVGLISLVVDVGFMYSEKKKIETAANAGFRSGSDFMMELRSNGYLIDSRGKELVTQRVLEVAAENMNLASSAIASDKIKVEFFDEKESGPRGLKVTGSSTQGLFFANIFDFKNFTVTGGRDNDTSGGGGTGSGPWFNSCPLGVPNGVIEDLSKNIYRYTPFPATQSPHLVDREPPSNPNNPDYDPANPDFAENHGGDDESDDYEGFVPGVEYILKLGSGGGESATTVVAKILVPMVPPGNNNRKTTEDTKGQTTNDAYLKAYGVAYWCLKIDDNDTDCHLPVEWLLGYKGGAFLLPWGNPSTSFAEQDNQGKILATRLKDRGIKFRILVQGSGNDLANRCASITAKLAVNPAIDSTYQEITAGASILEDLFEDVGEHVLSLDGETGKRFKVGLYSTPSDNGAFSQLLKLAEIPYGSYSPARNDAFASSSCSYIYDSEICNGQLTDYKFLYLHNEDFTGFTGGCRDIWDTCYDYNEKEKATAGEFVKNNASDSQLCPHCTSFYHVTPGGWGFSDSDSRCKDFTIKRSNCELRDFYGGLITTLATYTILLNRPSEAYANVIYTVDPGSAATFYPSTIGRSGSDLTYYYNRGASSTAYPLDPIALSVGNWNLRIPFHTFIQIFPDSPNGYIRIRVRDIEPGIWPNTQYKRFCDNYGLRCAERQIGSSSWFVREANGLQGSGTPYIDFFATNANGVAGQQSLKMCRYDDPYRPRCQSFKTRRDTATSLGFTDDFPSGYADYNSYIINKKLYASGSRVIQSLTPTVVLPEENDFVKYPNRVQKMKYKVARLIRDHVDKGGHLFSHGFSPETLDMALYHARLYERLSATPDASIRPAGVSIPATGDYSECLAFQNFQNRCFFNAKLSEQYYSSINALNSNAFVLQDLYDPRCQTHGSINPLGGVGDTNSYLMSLLKYPETNLGTVINTTTISGYCKGEVNEHGSFTFMGGDSFQNLQAQRLALNNVLLGAISGKTAAGEAGAAEETLIGKGKSNYGCLDTDNTSGGGANDYRDRLSGLLNDADLDINYRVTTESGNMTGPTEQGVASRTWHDLSCSDPKCMPQHCLTCGSAACNHTRNNTLCPVYNSTVGTFTPTNPRARIIVPITDVPPQTASDSQNASATTIYDLQGNDHPDGAYLPEDYNFVKSPRIIGFGEFEVLPPCCFTRIYNDVSRKGYKSYLGPAQVGQLRAFFVKYIIKPNPEALR